MRRQTCSGRGIRWRTLEPEERAILQGIPPAAVQTRELSHNKDSRQVGNSAIGNGFHLPSIMIVLMLLLQGAATTAGLDPRARGLLYAADEAKLRERILGTAFDELTLRDYPGIMNAQMLVDDMQIMIEDRAQQTALPWVRRPIA